MQKMKRAAIIREVLEAKLKKNERRIQTIAEASYEIRKMIEQIDALTPQTPYVKPKDGEIITTEPAAV